MISPSCCDVKGTDFGLATRAEDLRDSVCEASEAVEVARSRPGHTMLALFLLFDTDDRFLDEGVNFPDLETWRSSRCLRLGAGQQSETWLELCEQDIPEVSHCLRPDLPPCGLILASRGAAHIYKLEHGCGRIMQGCTIGLMMNGVVREARSSIWLTLVGRVTTCASWAKRALY